MDVETGCEHCEMNCEEVTAGVFAGSVQVLVSHATFSEGHSTRAAGIHVHVYRWSA